MKENIYRANLKSKDGNSVTVVSDGTQSVRPWIEKEVVRLLIADYNNPGRENFLIPHAEKWYRPLKRGDKIEGVIKLVF